MSAPASGGGEDGDDSVVLARVCAPHGVRGWLRLALHTRNTLNFPKLPRWRVSRDRRAWSPAELEGFRPQPGGKALAKLVGVDDRDAAAKLRGFYLATPRADLPETDADEFYWHDLIGMRALGRDGGALGEVCGLIRTGAHDILRVARQDGGEILIPFVAECAPDVDMRERVIRTEWEADW